MSNPHNKPWMVNSSEAQEVWVTVDHDGPAQTNYSLGNAVEYVREWIWESYENPNHPEIEVTERNFDMFNGFFSCKIDGKPFKFKRVPLRH